MNTSHYPETPGYKVNGTSQEAAIAVTDRARTLRDQVYGLLAQRDLTADECATLLDSSVLAVRPRLSELRKTGKIEETGQRRKNLSGHSASVWRVRAA